jgi:hypothetical protein
MGSNKKTLVDFLRVNKKSLGDFLELFGMEKNNLPLLGVTEIEIPSFDISKKVYFLIYDNKGKMGYKGFRPTEAPSMLREYNSINYYEGEINTGIKTGFLLKIGNMYYRELNSEEKKEIEGILKQN